MANQQVFPQQKPKTPNIKIENKARSCTQIRMADNDDFSWQTSLSCFAYFQTGCHSFANTPKMSNICIRLTHKHLQTPALLFHLFLNVFTTKSIAFVRQSACFCGERACRLTGKMMLFSLKTPCFCVKIRFIRCHKPYLASSLPIDFFYFESLYVPF